jgi:hypothetical protein
LTFGSISPHPALSPVGRGEGRGGPYVKEINAFVLVSSSVYTVMA